MSKKLYDVKHLLDCDYLQVSRDSGVTANHCVIFFYYMGSIAVILRKYQRASYFYDLAISMPSKSVHSASVESYKKQVLLKLISEGSEYHPPHSAPPRFNSILRHQSCEPYSKLASLFVDVLKSRSSKEALMQFIAKYRSIWTSDKNIGLINRVKEAIARHQIRKLTKVYESLSFQQLIDETQEANALDILVKMIEDGDINGKIDRQKETVVFFDKEYPVTVDEIQGLCEKIITYAEHVENRTMGVSIDPRYLKQLILSENMLKNR